MFCLIRCVDPCHNKAYGVCGENARCNVDNTTDNSTSIGEYNGKPVARR